MGAREAIGEMIFLHLVVDDVDRVDAAGRIARGWNPEGGVGRGDPDSTGAVSTSLSSCPGRQVRTIWAKMTITPH